MAEKHAAVLGLQAFVQLAAYDVPGWLPGVLTSLASAAPEPAPIRTTVRASRRRGSSARAVHGQLQQPVLLGLQSSTKP